MFPTKALYYDWQLKTRPPRVVEKIAYDKTKDKGLSKDLYLIKNNIFIRNLFLLSGSVRDNFKDVVLGVAKVLKRTSLCESESRDESELRHPNSGICCDGKVFSRKGGNQCCGGKPFFR